MQVGILLHRHRVHLEAIVETSRLLSLITLLVLLCTGEVETEAKSVVLTLASDLPLS